MKAFFKFIKSKVFILNVLAALALFVVVLTLTIKALDAYTLHGETIAVPSFKNLNKNNLDHFIQGKHLRYVIIDSSIYNPKRPKGVVIDQDPEPMTKVKDNRTIYLTINASLPQQIKMPNLVDVSFRQAEAILQTYGLKLGELIYKPDLAKNAVLGQQYRGKEIAPGTSIKKGSLINLILGDGLSRSEVTVPNLLNLTYEEAIAELKSNSLNTGSVLYDDDDDTFGARVYKQRPAHNSRKAVRLGESVDLFLTKSFHKIKSDTLDVTP
jgi:beta-lactam-binding protein with PASTA domain